MGEKQTFDNFICGGIWQQHNVYEARNTADREGRHSDPELKIDGKS